MCAKKLRSAKRFVIDFLLLSSDKGVDSHLVSPLLILSALYALLSQADLRLGCR